MIYLFIHCPYYKYWAKLVKPSDVAKIMYGFLVMPVITFQDMATQVTVRKLGLGFIVITINTVQDMATHVTLGYFVLDSLLDLFHLDPLWAAHHYFVMVRTWVIGVGVPMMGVGVSVIGVVVVGLD